MNSEEEILNNMPVQYKGKANVQIRKVKIGKNSQILAIQMLLND